MSRATKKTTKKVRRRLFIVALGYHSECCRHAHVWVKGVMAEDEESAKRILFRAAQRREFECDYEASVVAAPLSHFARK